MNTLVSTLRFASRRGIAQRLAVRSVMPIAFVPSRGYAKKTIEAVVNEKQKKQEFVRMLDEEVSVLRTSLDEADSSSVSTEVTDRFLKETGFVLTEDKEEGIIKLTRTTADKIIEVTFSDTPEEYQEKMEEDVEEEEEQEGTENEKTEEDEEETQSESADEREHSFTVELKPAKEGKDAKTFLLQCFAKNDGSFVVNKLTSGDYIPVQISYWSEDLQRELIAYLEPLGVNERLSNFIHQYLTRRETEENVKILEDFREFVNTK
eukprot:Phypoly_transcript_15768.p1 GENE.Phypoly_transcript_15768~~Phypoly_transcript_15768.p1  ORF type:complete len:263 (+),score=49.34 Phypoly_transcript_15768:104-892(+)